MTRSPWLDFPRSIARSRTASSYLTSDATSSVRRVSNFSDYPSFGRLLLRFAPFPRSIRTFLRFSFRSKNSLSGTLLRRQERSPRGLCRSSARPVSIGRSAFSSNSSTCSFTSRTFPSFTRFSFDLDRLSELFPTEFPLSRGSTFRWKLDEVDAPPRTWSDQESSTLSGIFLGVVLRNFVEH